MKAPNPWITYRTRFLVKAKQLTTSLTFIDLLGRHQSGRKGDYLVESAEGVLSIAPRQIFEDIYVPVQASETTSQEQMTGNPRATPQYETTHQDKAFRPTGAPQRETTLTIPSHLTRKLPQSDRDRRNPASGLRSL